MRGDLSGNPRVRPQDLMPPINFVGGCQCNDLHGAHRVLPHGLTYGGKK
jgi:hypothetical protein